MLCGGVLPTDRLNHRRAVVRSAEIGLTTGSGGRKQPKHHREDQNRCRVNRPRMAVSKIRLMNQHATMKPRMIPNATSIGFKGVSPDCDGGPLRWYVSPTGGIPD